MPDLTELGNYKKWLQEVPVKGVINIEHYLFPVHLSMARE